MSIPHVHTGFGLNRGIDLATVAVLLSKGKVGCKDKATVLKYYKFDQGTVPLENVTAELLLLKDQPAGTVTVVASWQHIREFTKGIATVPLVAYGRVLPPLPQILKRKVKL